MSAAIEEGVKVTEVVSDAVGAPAGMVSQMTGKSFDRLVNHIRKEKHPIAREVTATYAPDYTIATTTRFKGASSGAGMRNLFGLYGIDEYIL